MKNRLTILLFLFALAVSAQTQPFNYGGKFTGNVNFETSPSVPSKATPSGNNPTAVATEAQVFISSWQNGLSVYTFNSDASWAESGSLNIALNTAIPEATWTDAYGVEIWWNEGAAATSYKRTLEHYADNISINSINRSSSGNLVVSLDVTAPFTIPAGAKLIIKKSP